jgi:predicted dehydrogenase
MNLTPEEKAVGQENYYSALGAYDRSAAAEKFGRRDFLKGLVATGAVSGLGLGAAYFGYEKVKDPVRIGVIGTGDEGSVLIGACNPEYVDIVAIADIRPYNIHRAFHGDWASDTAISVRPGIISRYGFADEKAARDHVKVYTDYKELLKNDDVEAVIIALPLHLHAQAAIDAMNAGKHVLTEKLMAHNVAQCKVMGRVAKAKDLYLAVGHQRHYSVLYDNAVNLLRWGLLGEVHHIRAQWHRGNLPGRDSWQQPLPGGEMGYVDGKLQKIDPIARDLANFRKAYERVKNKDSADARLLEKKIAQWEAWMKDASVKAENYGYESFNLGDGRTRSALEELCRWRLFKRTGGGLMAELGSHQLDAASIFVSALRKDGKKAHPLSVHAVGGLHTFPVDRHAEDHVYCMYEFPGPGYDGDFKPGYYDPAMNYPDPKKGIPSYDQDPNKRIVVTYSSIMGNGFGGYGEIVMGSKGTLVLEREQDVLLYKDSSTTTKVGVKDDKGGPTLDTQASGKGPALAKAVENQGPVSRGYTEEIEHWAWCIRNPSPENQPRCKPEVALGDAVIALASNVAIENAKAGKGGYLAFKEEWYDIDNDETPDGSSVKEEIKSLGADLT